MSAASPTVDIGADYRLAVPVRTDFGAVLALEDLAADKVLALEARALPRDFVDTAPRSPTLATSSPL